MWKNVWKTCGTNMSETSLTEFTTVSQQHAEYSVLNIYIT